ncbi:MAG: M12 family metallo-peptidase, partial [Saprospiraceae bacterium]
MYLLNYFRRSALLLLFLSCFTLNNQAQSHQSIQPTIQQINLFETTEKPSDFSEKDYVQTATYLQLQSETLLRTLATRPQRILLTLPTADGQVFKLDLTTTEVLSSDFQLTTNEGKRVDYERGLYYTGSVNGNTKSVAAVSLFKNMVMAVVAHEGKHYVLGHLQQNKFPASNDYVFYQENDLQIANKFACGTDDLDHQYHDAKPTTGGEKSAKVVRVYFEGDYRLYQDKNNSEANVTDYITGLYNVVRALYQNENIDTEISEILVWTSPDPYPSSSSDGALNAFQSRLNGNYNGDLAHLVSTVNANNGGIAYVDALCAPIYGIAYSNIGRTYSEFPTYSWTVSVVTHEMGHNLGSPHTQSCSWSGGALDNCYPTEGNCDSGPAPTNGGTIMSYCHLSQYGINFQNGFGNQPGDLIRNRVAAASCLGEGDGGNGGGDNGGGGEENGTPSLTSNGGELGLFNEIITATLSVLNMGSGASTGGEIGYYLSTDDSFSTAEDLFIGSESIPDLAAGERSPAITFTQDTRDLNVPAGDYFVIYFIDYQDVVAEIDENDNLFYWSDPVITIEGDDDNGGETNTEYCPSTGVDASYEWISQVQIGDLNSNSNSDGGYADYTSRIANLGRGSAVDVALNASYSGDPYSEFWRVWIDFNQDNDFDDAGELVFESDTPSQGETSGILNIPANAPLVATRMRVSMKWYEEDNTIQDACDTFGYGEVEDYTVNITEESTTPTCEISEITAGEQTACDANSNTYEQQITVSYNCSGAATIGIYVNEEYLGEVAAAGSPTAINITGLEADGNAVDIRAEVCKNGQSTCPDLVKTALFTAPDACDEPQGEPCVNYPSERSVDDITTSAATINWSAAEDALYYQVR